jgi:hypothetical protein
MGRYARFTTGFEYKFAFGVQESLDITEFYGAWKKNMDEYENSISWIEDEDKEMIFEKLDKMKKENPILPEICWEIYKPSMEGTYELRDFFYEKVPQGIDSTTTHNGMMFYKYLLGCLIYHQLTYSEDLSCDFEF